MPTRTTWKRMDSLGARVTPGIGPGGGKGPETSTSFKGSAIGVTFDPRSFLLELGGGEESDLAWSGFFLLTTVTTTAIATATTTRTTPPIMNGVRLVFA